VSEPKIRTVFISVTAKDDPPIVDSVRQLKEIVPLRIMASGGSCRYLREAGFEDVEDIADVIAKSMVQQFHNAGLKFMADNAYQVDMGDQLPALSLEAVAEKIKAHPLLGHRVVTLSREKSAMLLARYSAEDTAELEALGLSHIDMVICDFYALQRAIEAEGATTESVCEATDIGGPGMVSEAAKGRRIVVCDPADRQMVIDEMRENGGEITEETRNDLCAKADGVVAEYRLDSARFHSKGVIDGVVARRIWTLDKGESGAQSPAFLHSSHAAAANPLSWRNFTRVSGNPGWVNLADENRILQIMCKSVAAFKVNLGRVPYIVLWGKHGNLCGMGIDFDNPLIALILAGLGDSVAAMGGEVMTNFSITDELGEALFNVPEEYQARVGRPRWGVDIIMAPSFSDASVELLGKRAKRKLLANSALSDPPLPTHERMIVMLSPDEFLTQKAPYFVFNYQEVEEWIGPKPTEQDKIDMIIAWVSAWYADSNTASLAKNSQLLAVAPGNQDRISCFAEAIRKARRSKHDITGAKAGSDGFLPYPKRSAVNRLLEGAQLCQRAGCSGIVVPADGQNLALTKAFFKDAGMQAAFVPAEHRGFMFHTG